MRYTGNDVLCGDKLCADTYFLFFQNSLAFLRKGIIVLDKTLLNLLKDVKNGNEDAFVDLSFRYAPLIDSLLAKYPECSDRFVGFSEWSSEDFRQEAEIALYNAALSYDTEQSKVTFGLYAGVCIRNRIISILRRKKSEAVGYACADTLGEGMICSAISSYRSADDPALAAVSAESYENMLRNIGSRLTSYEKRIFSLYLSGMTVAEIALKLKKERKSVENAIFRIRTKIRQMISERGC